jgi:hypothetical protein
MLAMNLTHSERVGRALESLRNGLLPFVVGALRRAYNDEWEKEARESLHAWQQSGSGELNLDIQAMINILLDRQHSGLFSVLTPPTRTFIFEIRDVRRRHAHQENFNAREVDRALDTMELLLTALGSTEANNVAEIRKQSAVRPPVATAATARNGRLVIDPKNSSAKRFPYLYPIYLSPILVILRDGEYHSIEDIHQHILAEFPLSQEQLAMKHRSGVSVFVNKVAFAFNRLVLHKAIVRGQPASYRITDHGREVLQRCPTGAREQDL